MKKIEAIIRPEKLEDVKNAIENMAYTGVTISEVEGHGKQKGLVQSWRGEKYRIEFLPKIKIEIVVPDNLVEDLITCIIENAKTGEIGDGKIFVYDVYDAIRIRTGERKEKAL